MKYCFKYHSNTSFQIYPATDSAGYETKELKEIYRKHLETELRQLNHMSDTEFLDYFGAFDASRTYE